MTLTAIIALIGRLNCCSVELVLSYLVTEYTNYNLSSSLACQSYSVVT